jgi:membrane protease YdiL (CAAX protease family)
VLAVLVLSAVLVAAVLVPAHRQGPIGVWTALLGTILPTMIAAGVAIAITKVRGGGPVEDLRLSVTKSDIKLGFKLGGLGLILTIAAVSVWGRIVGNSNTTSAVAELTGQSHWALTPALIIFLYTWLVGPVCEEIIFRGMCWGAMDRLKWGQWTAFSLSTCIFAASHLEPARTVLLLIITIPIGLGRLLTGRLGAGIIAHSVNNFLPAVAVLLTSLGIWQ